ncbi:hypothetical protein [Methylobacterium sp. 1030]|uniref:WD40 repeat domain-containing protein n=1 Tax=Methylobacterium sp. 1030 TaxID=3156404 RepID=UPI003390C27F
MKYDYDAFATYATDPDRDLVRAAEVFVEGFHRRRTLPSKLRHKLELCVDGRDFKIPRRSRAAGGPEDVADIIEGYLGRSRALIVFCGPLSRFHPWINHEVGWWVKNRPGAPVYFALTHGRKTTLGEVMPPALLARGGGETAIYIDLRGWYQDRVLTSAIRATGASRRRAALWRSLPRWDKVRSFREEAARLTTLLLSDVLGADLSVGEVEAAWEREEAWRKTRTRVISAGFLTLAAVGSGAVWIQAEARQAADDRAKAESWLQRSRMLVGEGAGALPSALAYAAGALQLSPSARSIEAGYLASEGMVPIETILTPGGGDSAWTARYLGDTGWVAVGGRSSVLRLVDPRTGDVHAALDLKSSGIRSLEYDASRHILFVGTDRGLVRLSLHTDGGPPLLSETGRGLIGDRVDALALDAARGRVLAGLSQKAEIWGFPIAGDAIAPGNKLARVMDPRFAENGVSDMPASVYGLAVRGGRLVAVGIDGVISVFGLAGNELGQPRQSAHPKPIYGMAVTGRGDELAVADAEGGLSVYGLDDLRLRRSETRPTAVASVGRDLDGKVGASIPDSSANVGLAISGDERALAVTSHDRSVRFVSFSGLAPLGTAVHRAAPRGVLFDPDGERALTFSDDGTMQVVRPLAQAEALRLAGIGGFAAGDEGQLVVWPMHRRGKPGYGRNAGGVRRTAVFAVDPEDGAIPRRIGDVEEDPREAVVQGGVTIVAGRMSTKVHLLPLRDRLDGCGLLQHPNSEGDVEMVRALVPGPGPANISTHGVAGASKAWWLSVWDQKSCQPVGRWEGTARGAVADGAWAIVDGPGSVTVRSLAAPARSLTFEGDVEGVDLSRGGAALVVRLRGGAACACTSGARPASRDTIGRCVARSTAYACHEVTDRAPTHGSLTAAHVSPTGRSVLIDIGSHLEMADASGLGGLPRRVGPDRLRSSEQPYAFNRDDSLLAVPAGETGVRVIDVATGRAIADLPTPGAVSSIAFHRGRSGTERLATLDGAILRLWDWTPDGVLRQICRRWNPLVEIRLDSDVPALLSRAEICGRFEISGQ